MPYTDAQRRLFHEMEENPDAARRHGVSRDEAGKLADEADRLAREGRTKDAATTKFDPGGSHGKLHRELGVPEDKDIPEEKLREATHSKDREVRDDAIRAETMEKWKHKSLIDLTPVFGSSRTPK